MNFSSIIKEDSIFSNVKVIVLEKRKKYIKETLAKMSLPFSQFDAILGEDINIENLIATKKLDKNHSFKNKNEIACYLSHIACIENFYKSSMESIFIFEDDIEYTSFAKEKVNKAMQLTLKDWDIVNFGRCWANCFKESKKFSIIKTPDFLCAHSYAVSREGARKILTNCYPAKVPVDILYRSLSKSGALISYASSPRIFSQRRETNTGLSSSLQNLDNCRECTYIANEDILLTCFIIIILLLAYFAYLKIKK